MPSVKDISEIYELIRELKVEVAELRAEIRTIIPERDRRIMDLERTTAALKSFVDQESGRKTLIGALCGTIGALVVGAICALIQANGGK